MSERDRAAQLTNGEDPMQTGPMSSHAWVRSNAEADALDEQFDRDVQCIFGDADYPPSLQRETVLDADTIRACIEALPMPFDLTSIRLQANIENYRGRNSIIEQCRAALEALLPAPVDPAKAIVREWTETGDFGQALVAAGWSGDFEPAMFEHFARWLISTGRIKP